MFLSEALLAGIFIQMRKPLRILSPIFSLHLLLAALLDAGADINAATADTGQTALHLAAVNGRTDMRSLLIQRGARTDVKDRAGSFPELAASILAGAGSSAVVGPSPDAFLEDEEASSVHTPALGLLASLGQQLRTDSAGSDSSNMSSPSFHQSSFASLGSKSSPRSPDQLSDGTTSGSFDFGKPLGSNSADDGLSAAESAHPPGKHAAAYWAVSPDGPWDMSESPSSCGSSAVEEDSTSLGSSAIKEDLARSLAVTSLQAVSNPSRFRRLEFASGKSTTSESPR